MFRRFSLCLCILMTLPLSALGGVPASITVQGRLTDAGGIPLPAGSKSFTFRIFDAAAGGTQIWPSGGVGEVQPLNSDAAGLWIGLIGTDSILTDVVFLDSVRWLEIDVDGTTLPRVRLVTAPTAFRVSTVDGASGGNITSKISIGSGHTNTGAQAFVAGVDNQVTGDYSAVGGGTLNVATAVSSVISGGQQNDATGFASSVGGGSSNTASNTYAAIGGGLGNTASNLYTTIGGGQYNTSAGASSVIGGGALNSATSDGATVSGGSHNNARGQYATVAGGGGPGDADSNTASGYAAQVGGGWSNVASGVGSGVDGGYYSIASGIYSTVGGGRFNFAEGSFSVIAGGGGPSIFNNRNTAQGYGSVIGGGSFNLAVDNFTTIGGGQNQQTRGQMATISGGNGNLTDGEAATVGGGNGNTAAGNGATVSGGRFNYTVVDGAVIAGGDTNAAHMFYSVIGGGILNNAYGIESVIDGGRGNTASGYHSSIGGGAYNAASGTGSNISGGFSNAAIGDRSTIGGGEQNRAFGSYSTVCGGGGGLPVDSNSASGNYAFVGGGTRNYASGPGATTGGGDSNRAKGQNSAIGGGGFNVAGGGWSTVPGGHACAANADFSFAAGSYARANHFGSFVWADRSSLDTTYSTANNQFIVRAVGGVGIGTNSPLEQLSVAGGMNIDHLNVNNGTVANGLRFGAGSGEVIASKRTAGGNQYGLDFYTNSANRMSITNATGYVGFGLTNPGFRIDLPNIANTDGQGRANAWTIYSSRRWKKNITPLRNALATVEQLQGVEYDNTSDGSHSIGLIAEEVGRIIPQVVQYEENGVDASSLDYARLTALLIEAVKEQQEQIDELKSAIKSMTP